MGVAWRDTPLEDKTNPDGDPFALLPECVTTAQDRLNDLRPAAPKFFIGVRPQILQRRDSAGVAGGVVRAGGRK